MWVLGYGPAVTVICCFWEATRKILNFLADWLSQSICCICSRLSIKRRYQFRRLKRTALRRCQQYVWSLHRMQARLKNKNSVTVFILCAAHALNLFGEAAVCCWADGKIEMNEKERALTAKSLSNTWQARDDALLDGNNSFQNALRDIASDLEQTHEARHEAWGL